MAGPELAHACDRPTDPEGVVHERVKEIAKRTPNYGDNLDAANRELPPVREHVRGQWILMQAAADAIPTDDELAVLDRPAADPPPSAAANTPTTPIVPDGRLA